MRELISNAADACEKLRYESLSNESSRRTPARRSSRSRSTRTSASSPSPTMASACRATSCQRARRHRQFRHPRLYREVARPMRQEPRTRRGAHRPLRRRLLLGLHGRRPRRGGDAPRRRSDEAWLWASTGKGAYPIAPLALDDAPGDRRTRDAASECRRATNSSSPCASRRIVREHSGASRRRSTSSRSPARSRAASPTARRCGRKPEIRDHERGIHRFLPPAFRRLRRAGADCALARGRPHANITVLAFMPGARPFDLFEPSRKSKSKLYVRRVLISRDDRTASGLAALRADRGRQRGHSAQRLARNGAEKPSPRVHGQGDRDAAAAGAHEARRERPREIRERLGEFRRGPEGRAARGPEPARRRSSPLRASPRPNPTERLAR